MKISIMGLGYVGSVSAACLTRNGHRVIGVDTNKTKVDLINNGLTPIIEKDVGELIRASADKQLLSATTNTLDAVFETELTLICVGTPSMLNGNLDLTYVRHVCEEIAIALRDKHEFHTVVVRSTMLPGSMQDVVIPILEEISNEMRDQVVFVKHNIDEQPNMPVKYGVRGIPTMLIFKNGELKGTKVGSTTKSNIVSWIKENL